MSIATPPQRFYHRAMLTEQRKNVTPSTVSRLAARAAMEAGAVKTGDAPSGFTVDANAILACADAELLRSLDYHLAKRVRAIAGSATLIAGVGLAGKAIGRRVAELLGLPMVYVRPKAKGHGVQTVFDGDPRCVDGGRAVILGAIEEGHDDALQPVHALRDAGGEVKAAILFTLDDEACEGYAAAGVTPEVLLPDASVFDNVTNGAVGQASRLSSHSSDALAAARDEEGRDRRDACPTSRETASANLTAHDVAGALLDIAAFAIDTVDGFTYTKGGKGPIYVNNRLLASHPLERQLVAERFAAMALTRIGIANIDAVAGVATAGIDHAADLANRLGKPMLMVKGEQIFGRFAKAARVLVIEDLINTAGSAVDAADVLRGAGATVDACLAIFDYDFDLARRRFAARDITCHTLTTLDATIAEARRRGSLDDTGAKIILDWRTEQQRNHREKYAAEFAK